MSETTGDKLIDVLEDVARKDERTIAGYESVKDQMATLANTVCELRDELKRRNDIDEAMADRDNRAKENRSELLDKVRAFFDSQWVGRAFLVLVIVGALLWAKQCGMIVNVDTPVGSVTQGSQNETQGSSDVGNVEGSAGGSQEP